MGSALTLNAGDGQRVEVHKHVFRRTIPVAPSQGVVSDALAPREREGGSGRGEAHAHPASTAAWAWKEISN
jgi:hypothetical protein